MLCRLCLYECEDSALVSLFSDGGESGLTKLIAKYMYIEVTQHDIYSTNICSECLQNINDFHKYFKHVEERQNALQNSLHDIKDPDKSTHQEAKAVVKPIQKFEETVLDIKEFISEEERDQLDLLTPQIEFAYATLDDKVNESDDCSNELKECDEDDEPLQNLLQTTRNKKTTKDKMRKTSKTFKTKKVIGKRKRYKSLKKNSAKKCRAIVEDSNDNTNDADRSIKQSKNACTAEEDKLREELIAKHIQLKCEICDTSVSSYRELRVHFRTEHNRKPYVTCCGKRFRQRFLLVDHINSHLNPDHFKCTICGKVFISRISVAVHMANKHADREKMRHCCDVCGKRFSHQSILTTHMLVHTEERNHMCGICNKGFKSVHMLKAHTQHMHGEKTPYVCETCGKEYRFKLSFDRHVAEHQGLLGDQQQQCPTCGKWFSPNYLRRHVKRHELEDVDCEKCGKTFKSKAALASHMEYSHRPKRTYSCTFCEKTFDRALNLKEHIDMHTGQKEYNCAHCPREFRSRANMYAHVKKMHFEQWTQAQLIRNRGPNSTTNNSNETKNALAS